MSSASSPISANQVKVLVVDDSLADRRLAGTLMEKNGGWKVVYAGSGPEALAILDREAPNVVLTDLLMPGTDALKLVEAIHLRYPFVPIVLMTAHGNEDLALRALQKGAASYVPKKRLAIDLHETLEQVVSAARTDRRRQQLLDCATRVESHFVLDNDRALIPALIAHLQEQMSSFQLCDQANRIRVGIALEEALLNALYHGNLEVSSDLREKGDEAFLELAEERRQLSPFSERHIHFQVTLSRTEAAYVVRDEGPGFNRAILPDPTAPANLEKTSGRGLLLIHTFMDEVYYNQVGNEITMIKRRQPSPAE